VKVNEDIRPITYLKSRAADLIGQINETHRPVVITQKGEARAVIQDPESYENMRSAIGLLKLLAQGEEDVRQKQTTGQSEVFDRLEKRLIAMKSKNAHRK
jgi:prevent-host-death family protein